MVVVSTIPVDVPGMVDVSRIPVDVVNGAVVIVGVVVDGTGMVLDVTAKLK